MFEYLRSNNYLIKKGRSDYNLPTQRSLDMGLFKIRENYVTKGSKPILYTTTRVTAKGQIYFINKFINNSEDIEIY